MLLSSHHGRDVTACFRDESYSWYTWLAGQRLYTLQLPSNDEDDVSNGASRTDTSLIRSSTSAIAILTVVAASVDELLDDGDARDFQAQGSSLRGFLAEGLSSSLPAIDVNWMVSREEVGPKVGSKGSLVNVAMTSRG